MEVASVRLSTVGGVVSEDIVDLRNGILDKILHPFLGCVGEREAVQVGPVGVGDVNEVGQPDLPSTFP